MAFSDLRELYREVKDYNVAKMPMIIEAEATTQQTRMNFIKRAIHGVKAVTKSAISATETVSTTATSATESASPPLSPEVQAFTDSYTVG